MVEQLTVNQPAQQAKQVRFLSDPPDTLVSSPGEDALAAQG